MDSPHEHGYWKFRQTSPTALTITGLVLSLPFAITASLMFVAGFIVQFEMAAGLITQPWESSRGACAELFGMMAACCFLPAVPGAILAIMGFVKERTRLAWITQVVVAAPWFLGGLHLAVALVLRSIR